MQMITKAKQSYFKSAVMILLTVASCHNVAQTNEQTVNGQKIKYTTEDSFVITGDYYQGQRGGVILLHSCNNDRRSLTSLAEALSAQGLHALNLDFRGYGDSVSEQFSQQKVKRNSKDLVSYQSEMARYMSYWQSDVLAGYHFLRAKVERDQPVSVVATDCAVAQAVGLAEKVHIDHFVILSPRMGHVDKERYKNLYDKPTYFISSAHDSQRHLTANELFEWNGDKRSKIQIFNGSRSGTLLLKQEKHLATDIALWLLNGDADSP